MDDTMLDEWAWVQVTLGYDRNRKPIQVVCVRDRGTYQDVFDKEKKQFLDILAAHDDVEAGLVRGFVERARFVLTTRFAQNDMTDEGYDFNGWILEFFQDQCSGIVQIDNQGFYSPKGDLIVDLSSNVEWATVAGPAPPDPPPLYQKTDHWFQRATAALLGEVPCRLGCTSCCIGPFPITILDVQTLQQGLAALPPDHRHRIEQRAIKQTAAMEASFPQLTQTDLLDNWPDREIDRLVTEFHHHPCPALETDGRCGIYHHRPLACRSMGIPTEDRGLAHGACEVQTFIPILRLPSTFREEEDRLAQEEGVALNKLRQATGITGEEVFLPYGFLAGRRPEGSHGNR
jgi:Fe-S-cluster containining protein